MSSKHCSAFIQTARNKPLESNASSKQLKRLRKLWFAHSIWGEEAKLPHWQQPSFPYNLCNRGVTAAHLQLQTRQHHCRILLFLLTDQMVLIHRSQTQHFPMTTLTNVWDSSEHQQPSEEFNCIVFQTAQCCVFCKCKGRVSPKRICSKISVSQQWELQLLVQARQPYSLSLFFFLFL